MNGFELELAPRNSTLHLPKGELPPRALVIKGGGKHLRSFQLTSLLCQSRRAQTEAALSFRSLH